MTRYKITIEYDGTNYIGWQKQQKGISIAGEIESALLKLTKQEIKVSGSGRTDAGVHAIGQVAHFDLEKDFEIHKIMTGINHYLDKNNITITDCQIANDDFNSRFDAKLRHYQYKILNRYAKPILERNRVYHVKYDLDIDKMQEAAKYLIGKHDFSSFQDSECQSKIPTRTIKEIEITKEGDLILINICAKSFLHHMVRNITGTLVQAGGNRIDPKEVKDILEAKDRTKSGPNAPACGLYFCKVDY